MPVQARLHAQGKTVLPGELVRFVYTLGKPGVFAWDQLERLDPRQVDLPRYKTLLLRAMAVVLQPFGITEPRRPLFLELLHPYQRS